MDTLGRHIIAELDGCDPATLGDAEGIRGMILEAARVAGATRLADQVFDFKDGGVSGFVLLAESHLSIHTWPEHAYAAVDIYTCGRHTRPDLACDLLAERLAARRMRTSTIDRGCLGPDGGHEHRPVGSRTWLVDEAHGPRPPRLLIRARQEHGV
jgi:S-adenosylmethionine decarboxylase